MQRILSKSLLSQSYFILDIGYSLLPLDLNIAKPDIPLATCILRWEFLKTVDILGPDSMSSARIGRKRAWAALPLVSAYASESRWPQWCCATVGQDCLAISWSGVC